MVVYKTPNISVRSGFLLLSGQGHISDVNDTFLSIFNLREGSFVGKRLCDIPHLKDLSAEIALLTEKKSVSFPCNFNLTHKNTDQSDLFLTININLITLDECEHTLISLCDKTELLAFETNILALHAELKEKFDNQNRELSESTTYLIDTNVNLRREIRDRQIAMRALQASEMRFRALTETTSDFIWEINKEGYYTYVSPKIKDLLGFTPEEFIGTKFLVFRNPFTFSKFIKDIDKPNARTQGFKGWQSTHIHRNGHKVVVESSGEPIFDKTGVFSGIRGIDRDVTERSEYQKQLKRAKEEAESANISKSEFLANMSHELRTPLHAILSFSNFGLKKTDQSTNVDIFQYFDQISTSAKRLMPLIDSLLDLSKLESGNMTYSIVEMDIMNEIKATITELTPLASQKNVSLELNKPGVDTVALIDHNKIGQVVRNILSNAIRFSYSNTRIHITLSDYREDEEILLLISISNKGIGIPDNELERVFEKFIQSSKTKTGAGGTGLGLSICKQIIYDHQGKIWVENRKNMETVFNFTLPKKSPKKKLGEILVDRGLVSSEDILKALRDQQ